MTKCTPGVGRGRRPGPACEAPGLRPRWTAILLIALSLFWIAATAGPSGAGPLTGQPGATPATAQASPTSALWIAATVAFILVIVGFFVGYMFHLQRRFFVACQEANDMATFMNTPAGLPAGTVRSIITLIILTVSLYIVALSLFDVVKAGVPEILSALLTAVIGFYFGSRSARGGGDAGEAVAVIRQARDAAVSEKEESEAKLYLKKVKKNLAMVQQVTKILPSSLREKFEPLTRKLQDGAGVAEKLLASGAVVDAAKEVKKAYEAFVKGNPVRAIVERAVNSFGRIAGDLVPPLGLVGSIVGVTSSLVGAGYAKWKARILGLPFDPAVVPLKLVDADTGFGLLLASPIFKKAFTPELQAMNRPFMEAALPRFLRDETDTLWKEFQDRFESREELEAGLQQFRAAAADLELKAEIEPGLLSEAGGYEKLVTAVDKIRGDEEAKADLDLLVETVEGLRRANEPVQSIFEKVKKEISE